MLMYTSPSLVTANPVRGVRSGPAHLRGRRGPAAPAAMAADEVTDAVREQHQAYLQSCGL